MGATKEEPPQAIEFWLTSSLLSCKTMRDVSARIETRLQIHRRARQTPKNIQRTSIELTHAVALALSPSPSHLHVAVQHEVCEETPHAKTETNAAALAGSTQQRCIPNSDEFCCIGCATQAPMSKIRESNSAKCPTSPCSSRLEADMSITLALSNITAQTKTMLAQRPAHACSFGTSHLESDAECNMMWLINPLNSSQSTIEQIAPVKVKPGPRTRMPKFVALGACISTQAHPKKKMTLGVCVCVCVCAWLRRLWS